MVKANEHIPIVGETKTHVNVNEKFLKDQVSKYLELSRDIVMFNTNIGSIHYNRSENVIAVAKLIQKQNLFGENA